MQNHSQQPTMEAAVNLGRHKRACSVCAHQQQEEIETAFIDWRSPAAIAKEFGLADRAIAYRHGLFFKGGIQTRRALDCRIGPLGRARLPCGGRGGSAFLLRGVANGPVPECAGSLLRSGMTPTAPTRSVTVLTERLNRLKVG